MLSKTTAVVALALAIGAHAVSAQRAAPQPPDLPGVCGRTGRSRPLQRPPDLAGKPVFSTTEAAEYERTWLEEFRKNFPPEDLQAPDIDYTYMDPMKVVARRRTSLITDPADGRLPPQLPAAKARADARPKTSNDDPELLGLDERCLLEVAFGSSNASPPMVPNPFGQNFYQIVQTDHHVAIHTEIVHDTRIIRIGGRTRQRRFSYGSAIRSATGKATRWWSTPRTSPPRRTSEDPAPGCTSSSTLRARARRRSAISSRRTILRRGRVRGAPRSRSARPRSASHEYACHEANYSMANVLRGARAEDKKP